MEKNTEHILVARNELENVVDGLQKGHGLSEADMMLVCEMLLSTMRYKALVRETYNSVIEERRKDEHSSSIQCSKGESDNVQREG